jgi:hypothetical protein
VSFFEMVNPHAEAHRGEHAGWLRAAVLGANDGLVSTASTDGRRSGKPRRSSFSVLQPTEEPMTMLAAQQLSASRKAVQRRQIRVFFLNSAPDSSSQADLSTRKIFQCLKIDLWSPKLKSNRRAQHRPRCCLASRERRT